MKKRDQFGQISTTPLRGMAIAVALGFACASQVLPAAATPTDFFAAVQPGGPYESLGSASINRAGEVVYDVVEGSVYSVLKWDGATVDNLTDTLGKFFTSGSGQPWEPNTGSNIVVFVGRDTDVASDPLKAFILDLDTDTLTEFFPGSSGHTALSLGHFSIDDQGAISFWRLWMDGSTLTHTIHQAIYDIGDDEYIITDLESGTALTGIVFAPVRDPDGSGDTLFLRHVVGGGMELRRYDAGIPGVIPMYTTAASGVISTPVIREGLVTVFINDPAGALNTPGIYAFDLDEANVAGNAVLVVTMDGTVDPPGGGRFAPAAFTMHARHPAGHIAFVAIDTDDADTEKLFVWFAGEAEPLELLAVGDEVAPDEFLAGGIQILGIGETYDPVPVPLLEGDGGGVSGPVEMSGIRILLRAVVTDNDPDEPVSWPVLAVFDEPLPLVGCIGFCGAQSPDGCWCDASCCDFLDCCENKCFACGASAGNCDLEGDCITREFCGSCAGDFTNSVGTSPDGVVNGFDLLVLLACWGPVVTEECDCADMSGPDKFPNQDGVVNGFDLLVLLALWGPCPVDAVCGGDLSSAGNCCSANGTEGCNDETCCSTICAADPYCCYTAWDEICALDAQSACGVCVP